MKPGDIKEIWPQAIKSRISAKVHLPDQPTVIFGFDTEYIPGQKDFEASTPVCWQWHDGKRGAVMPLKGQKLKLSDLTQAVMFLAADRDPQARHIVLASWYALAEISVLELDMQHQLLAHGNGRYGLRWKVVQEEGRHKKRVTYTISLFDLQAFYGTDPLSKITAHMPQPKLSWNHADTTLESYKIPEFHNYALHDAYLCAVLAHELHHEFSLGWGCSPFEMVSTGYMASALFRRWYITEDLMQPHPDVRALALRAYRGSGAYGGIWARGIFKGEYGEYDGASMYPSAAAQLGYLPRRGDWRPFNPAQTEYADRGIYRAQITWPENTPRLLLFAQVPDAAAPGGERWDYPVQGVDAWTGYELHAAERAGCKVRIIEGWFFETGTDALSTFLGQTTHKRKQFQEGVKVQASASLAAVYKNLGNTLIGKLGQNKKHMYYETVYNPKTDRVEYAPGQEPRQSLGGVFMPEWWVMIIGYSRAALMDVIREKDALHANVDAVLIPDCGEGFEHMGITFRRKSSGDTLRLAERNLWQFERGGLPVRMAAGSGGGRDLPETRAIFQTWEGQAIAHQFTITDAVKMSAHARNPQERPLLSRVTVKPIFKIPALEGENVRTKNHQGVGKKAGRSADSGPAAQHAGTEAGHSGKAGRRTEKSGGAEKGTHARRPAPGVGGFVKLLIDWGGVQTEKRVKRQKENVYRAVVAIVGTNYAPQATQAAAAVVEGMSYTTKLTAGRLRVEILD